ncbi:MAG: MBL fold metallo-hydrolase, partial [Phycisphaerae bacterium]
MSTAVRITILVDNNSTRDDLETEHGLALWIENKDKKILFDTGQSDLLLQNAEKLGVNLAQANTIVLSHGHYDHSGGLTAAAELAPEAAIYAHPDVTKPRYSCGTKEPRFVGISESAKKTIEERKAIWTEKPLQLCSETALTGRIPRTNDFEDVGGAFFTDENCRN